MDVVFLGTSAAVPSKSRSTSCIAVREGPDVLLLDCGEGAQRRIMASSVSFMRIGAVLVTHLHGDHLFGLPGLIQTMGLSGRTRPLRVCGPPGISRFLDAVACVTDGDGAEPPYPVEVAELGGGESFEVDGFRVECFRTDHGVASVGYVVREPDRPGRLDRGKALALGIRDGPDMARLKRGEAVGGVRPEDVVGPPVPGLSLAYTGDTRPSLSVAEAVRGVDLLIHESTYMDSEASNAEEHGHSTASQAAAVAREAGVGHLILTHVSHRYEDRSLLEAEARRVFPESYAAEDMETFRLTRGGLTSTDLGPA